MVLVSGVLRFVQDEKSTVAAESLAEMVESTAEVERDGDGGNEPRSTRSSATSSTSHRATSSPPTCASLPLATSS